MGTLVSMRDHYGKTSEDLRGRFGELITQLQGYEEKKNKRQKEGAEGAPSSKRPRPG